MVFCDLMGILGASGLRTKREEDICKKIIRCTMFMEDDNSFHGEGFRRLEKIRRELYAQLDKICKGDTNRYHENIFYIKKHIKHHHPKKVEIGGNIHTPAGGGGLKLGYDDRPNQ